MIKIFKWGKNKYNEYQKLEAKCKYLNDVNESHRKEIKRLQEHISDLEDTIVAYEVIYDELGINITYNKSSKESLVRLMLNIQKKVRPCLVNEKEE